MTVYFNQQEISLSKLKRMQPFNIQSLIKCRTPSLNITSKASKRCITFNAQNE